MRWSKCRAKGPRIEATEQIETKRRCRGPGAGKTYITVGLGIEDLRRGYMVRYITLDDLVGDFRKANQLREQLSYYQRAQLLICDEVGYPRGRMEMLTRERGEVEAGAETRLLPTFFSVRRRHC